jgi:hypothetical protein
MNKRTKPPERGGYFTLRRLYSMKTNDSASLKTISGVSKVPEYGPAAVKKLMARLDLNERAFAMLMNVAPMTVRFWTTGAAKPCERVPAKPQGFVGKGGATERPSFRIYAEASVAQSATTPRRLMQIYDTAPGVVEHITNKDAAPC